MCKLKLHRGLIASIGLKKSSSASDSNIMAMHNTLRRRVGGREVWVEAGGVTYFFKHYQCSAHSVQPTATPHRCSKNTTARLFRALECSSIYSRSICAGHLIRLSLSDCRQIGGRAPQQSPFSRPTQVQSILRLRPPRRRQGLQPHTMVRV